MVSHTRVDELDEDSLSTQIKRLERYILNLPLAKSLNTLARPSMQAMVDLTSSVAMARDNITRYLISDDTVERQSNLELSVEHIKNVNDYIIIASQYDLLDAVDVAHLSALTEVIKERLQ